MVQLNQSTLSDHINRQLVLVEIELSLIQISESLLNDSSYTNRDAVNELIRTITMINVEKDHLYHPMNRG